jgi:hypothetical protein
MTKKSAPEKTLAGILQQDPQGVLAYIQNKVTQLKKLNQIWHVEISADLAEHTRVANFREGYLIVECDSAAWATRLRYLLPDITANLLKHPDLRDLTHIEWSIQPQFHATSSQHSKIAPPISSASAQLLKHAADNITVKSLQEALLRISKNQK